MPEKWLATENDEYIWQKILYKYQLYGYDDHWWSRIVDIIGKIFAWTQTRHSKWLGKQVIHI